MNTTQRAALHLNGLRAFEAAARHLSFVRAAQELHVTPAAVSQHVRGLEAYLGQQLFRRTPGGLVPTSEARAALSDVHDGFDRLAMAQQRLKSRGPRSVVTVTTSPSFAAKWLMPRVVAFQAANAGIDLRLEVSERLVDFTREEVDIGVRYGTGHYPGLEVALLMGEQVFPVCSPALLQAGRSLRKPGDLARHTLIHDGTIGFDASFPTWRTWMRQAGVEHLQPAGELHLNSALLATQAALAGQGVALGRSVVVADDLAAGRLVQPFGPAGCAVECAYYVVHAPGADREPRVAAFKRWLLCGQDGVLAIESSQ